jgi:ABC-type uncharacterized transport system permease subunit
MATAESVVFAPVKRRTRKLRAAASSLAAVILALVIGGVLIVIAGGEPLSAYEALINGSLGTAPAFGQTLIQAVPLVIIGLGIALVFRARIYNIGAEGQLFVGALTGGAVAVTVPIDNGPLLIALAVIAGILGGAFWGAIVGVLRAKWNVNEVITSLLLTYVGTLLFSWAIRRPLRDPQASAGLAGEAVPDIALLPNLPDLYVHVGVFIAAALVPIMAYVMSRTPFGFRVGMLGYNADAAQTAGVPSGRMIITLMVVSGGLAGLAGIIQVLGVSGRLDPSLSSGYGFTAIVVALLGRLNAVGVLLAALFLAVLNAGGQAMSVTEGLPYAIVLAIQGVFVVFLLIADRLARGGAS